MMQRRVKNFFKSAIFASAFLLTATAFAETEGEPEFVLQEPACTDSIHIVISADTIRAGVESFWVDIYVGSETMPVDSLFGVSFELNFNFADYLRLAGLEKESLFPGPLLGDEQDLAWLAVPDFPNGVIRTGVTRKSEAGNTEGHGLLFRMNFFPTSDMPDFSEVEFSLSNIAWRDANGDTLYFCHDVQKTLILRPKDFTLTVTPDSTRIGKGEQTQYEINLEPIGGFAREVNLGLVENHLGVSAEFSSPTISPDTSPVFLNLATNGQSSEGVYPITVTAAVDTFFQQDATILAIYEIPLFPSSASSEYMSGAEFTIDLEIGGIDREVVDLKRLAFTLQYSDPQYIQPATEAADFVSAGEFVGRRDDITVERSDNEGLVSLDFDLPSGVSGLGSLAHLRFTSVIETPDGRDVNFALSDISAFNSKGDTIFLRPEAFSVTILEQIDFVLHINPTDTSVLAGNAAQYEISLTGSRSFDTDVPLRILGLPTEFLPDLQPNFVSRTSPALLTIPTDTSTAEGEYPFTVQGQADDIEREVAGLLRVVPAALFTLQISPERRDIFPGDSALFVVSVLDAEHLDVPVELEFVGFEGLAWAVPQLSPQRIAPESPAELILSTSNQARVGQYSFRVIGRSGNSTRDASAEVHILEPPPRVRPNPFTPNNDGFNDHVIFDFDELRTGGGEIIIFDVNGRKVKQLSGAQRWDGTDNNGKDLKPGAYLYVVRFGEDTLDKGVIGLAR